MIYNRRTFERLVMSANKDGIITFAQIRKIFPNHSDAFFYNIIGDKFRLPPRSFDTRFLTNGFYESVMLIWVNCPNDYKQGYVFKDSDMFTLSVSAQNLRYEYQCRIKSERLAISAAISGAIAAIASVIALLR